MRKRCRAAWQAARQGDMLRAVTADRYYSAVLSLSEGQPDQVKTAMFFRVAVLLEVLSDMANWPENVRGFTPRRSAGRVGRQPHWA